MVLKYFLLLITGICFIFLFTEEIIAGEPDYKNPLPVKNFIFGVGSGFGFSNNPCSQCESEKLISGFTFSGSLGYRINKKFKIDFGPSVWYEASDLFNNDLPVGERSKNKRITIIFNGYYYPFTEVPLSIKLGGGIGTLIYTRPDNKVSIEGKYNNQTEIFNGFAGNFALNYEFKIGDKLVLFPSANFSYINLEQQQIKYNTFIDSRKPSVTADFRLNLYFDF